MTRRLGRSQQKVLDYIKEHPGVTVKAVGEALYDSTSSCANWERTEWPKEKIRYRWAAGIVRKLGGYHLIRIEEAQDANHLYIAESGKDGPE